MGAEYYRADSENGDRMDDPSEDGLFMLFEDLDDADNTFVVIKPDEAHPTWYASVTTRREGGYEVVCRDTVRREHDVATETCIGQIAYDLTSWMAARDLPGQPGQSGQFGGSGQSGQPVEGVWNEAWRAPQVAEADGS